MRHFLSLQSPHRKSRQLSILGCRHSHSTCWTASIRHTFEVVSSSSIQGLVENRDVCHVPHGIRLIYTIKDGGDHKFLASSYPILFGNIYIVPCLLERLIKPEKKNSLPSTASCPVHWRGKLNRLS